MDFKTLLGQELTAQSKSAFAVYSIKEYLDSMKDKLTAWFSGDLTESVITLSRMGTDGVEQCFALSKTQYDAIVDGTVDQVDVEINTLGDTITLTSEEVMDCIKDTCDEIATQGSFLGYCLEKETVNATEFSTNVCTTIKSVSSSMIEKYSTLLTSGDAVHAIQSFFATSTIGEMVNEPDAEHGYIGIVRSQNFTGISVWRSAFIQIGNAIHTALTKVGKALWGMGNVLTAIGEGIYSLSYSLLKTVLSRYYTRFESLVAPVGIIDIPIMQLKLGTFDLDEDGKPTDHFIISAEESTAIYDAIHDRSVWETYSNYTTDDCVLCGGKFSQGIRVSDLLDGISTYYGYTDVSRGEGSKLYSEFAFMLYGEIFDDVDGVIMPRSIDYFIPGIDDTSSGIVLRLGVTENYEAILQIYCMLPKSYVKEADHDSEIYVEMVTTFYKSIKFLAKCGYPVMTYMPNNSGANTYDVCLGNIGTNSENTFFYPTGVQQDNYDVVAHCRFFNPEIKNLFGPYDYDSDTTNLELTYNLMVISYIHNGLFAYIIRNSKRFKEINDSALISKANLDIGFLWRNPNDVAVYEWRNMTGNHVGFTDIFPTDYSTLPGIINGYFPYLQRALTKPCIHYQTNAEMGREVAQGITVLAIAAAAVYVGVKWAKFSRRLKYKAEIAQGYADNMSWTIGSNPSKDDLKNYHKAKKKAKFLNGLCSSLGISSSSSESSSIFDVCLSIKDQMSSSFGLKENYSPSEEPHVVTTNDISELVEQVKTLVQYIKALIKVE